MNKLTLLTTAAILAFAAPAFAEQAMKATAPTAKFVKNATIGGKFEIESSQLALEKSQDAGIKEFAQTMIDDHKKADTELKDAVDSQEIDKTLTEVPLDAKHQAMLDKLKAKADGKAFDTAYIKAQKDAHKETVELFQGYAKTGDNAKIKGFASETLPTLKMHKEHANKLKAS